MTWICLIIYCHVEPQENQLAAECINWIQVNTPTDLTSEGGEIPTARSVKAGLDLVYPYTVPIRCKV